MRNLNPFLVLAVLTLLFIAVLMQQNVQKKKINEAILEYKENLKLAKSIENLKNVWQNRSYSKREIKNILNSYILRNQKKSVDYGNSGVEVKIEKIDGKKSQFLINRLLNSKLKIKKLKISKDSNSSLNIAFKVEY